MKTLKTVFAFALAAALVLSLNLTAFADSLPIGIPDDGTNLSRGIKLLETAGLITVDPEAGYTPEIADITGYLYDVEVTPVQANTLPSTLADFGASTINGTYAIPFGLIPSRDGLIIEKQSEDGDNPYVNIIAARAEDAENEVYQTIVKAYQTQAVAEFLLVNYEEAFFPAFDYKDDITLTKEKRPRRSWSIPPPRRARPLSRSASAVPTTTSGRPCRRSWMNRMRASISSSSNSTPTTCPTKR